MGETYQIWRDEFPEDTLVYKRTSLKGEPHDKEFSTVVIHLKDVDGGYKLYCKGSPSYVLPRCTYDDNVRSDTRKQISDLKKRKPLIEVVCLASKSFSSAYGEFVAQTNALKQQTCRFNAPVSNKMSQTNRISLCYILPYEICISATISRTEAVNSCN